MQPPTSEQLPFSQACENNKSPILSIIQPILSKHNQVLEIGSGTGQHAVHFAQALPNTIWQCADLAENHSAINAWLAAYPSPNLRAPIVFDMNSPHWPSGTDAVYSANTAHIMAWPLTQKMVAFVATQLPSGGHFLLYGPFNYNGQFTSDSNAQFDVWLKENSPERGIRDFEKVNEIAEVNGLEIEADHAMPANNRLLVWRKS